MKRGNRSIRKIILSSPFALVAAVILAVLLARAAWIMYQRADISSNKMIQAETELARLRERQTDLSAQVSLLSTDEGVESQLRTKYPAVKEGESVAVIIDSRPATATAVSLEPATTTASTTWWDRVLRFFGL